MVDVSGTDPRRNVGLLELFSEVLCILSRALQAAHYYETLRAASDELLAHRGLRHSDLPRAAYQMLTGEMPTRRRLG